MKIATKKKSKRAGSFFPWNLCVFLLAVYGLMPMIFPNAVKPLEIFGLAVSAFVLWRQSRHWKRLRLPWQLLSLIALFGIVAHCFREDLGPGTFGAFCLLWGLGTLFAVGLYLLEGHLANSRTLSEVGFSITAIAVLLCHYAILPLWAAQGFGENVFLLIFSLMYLLDIAVALAVLFFSSQRALLPPAHLSLGLGLLLQCLHFLSPMSAGFRPQSSGTMPLFLAGALLIAKASGYPMPTAESKRFAPSVFKDISKRRTWELCCRALPDALVFGLFIAAGAEHKMGGLLYMGALAMGFFLWLKQFETLQSDELWLKRAMEHRRELRQQNEELAQKSSMAELDASLDFLTRLYNRRYIERALARPKETADGCIRVGLLLIDVDFFKQVNDTLGHQSGDMVLRKVADGIRMVAGTRHIGGRFGGDEFILFLHDVTEDEMRNIANQLLSYIRSTLSHIPVTLSIGGAIYEGAIAGYDSGALTKKADGTLYKSKENGRDQYTSAAQEAAKPEYPGGTIYLLSGHQGCQCH